MYQPFLTVYYNCYTYVADSYLLRDESHIKEVLSLVKKFYELEYKEIKLREAEVSNEKI